MVGDWRLAVELGTDELLGGGGEEVPPGMEMTMTIDGSQSYHADGSYTAEADMHMHVVMMGQTVNMAFHVTDRGTWKINEAGKLVETSQESTAEPLDEPTRQMVAADPTVDDGFVVAPGTEGTFALQVVSEDEIVHVDENGGLAMTYYRK